MSKINPARTAARKNGLARFFTGLPCKFGHVAERYTKRGDCVICRAQLVDRWRKSNQEKYRDGVEKWQKENPERTRITRMMAMANMRARKRKAMPSWVDVNEIRKIYENCPIGMEVDHIWPLNGKTWSGLHVPWNLQYLTGFQNRSKGNKAPCL